MSGNGNGDRSEAERDEAARRAVLDEMRRTMEEQGGEQLEPIPDEEWQELERFRRVHRELQEAHQAYEFLPKNAQGHLEIGVSPEKEAWERLERAWAAVEALHRR